jgi:hypothetical protein
MKKMLVFYLSTLLLMGALIVPSSLAAKNSAHGVKRTQIEGVDNWAWIDNPLSPATIKCPGGELVIDPVIGPYCSDSKSGRLHFRDGVLWSCMTSNDPRITGVAVASTNGNFDANSTGSVWGTWMIVPMVGCDKDGAYPDELVTNATSFWQGTWNGKRQIQSVNGFNFWVGKLKFVGKGVGGDLDGLHFKGKEWITMYTPLPVPYELLPPALGLYDEPEGVLIGEIKE